MKWIQIINKTKKMTLFITDSCMISNNLNMIKLCSQRSVGQVCIETGSSNFSQSRAVNQAIGESAQTVNHLCHLAA